MNSDLAPLIKRPAWASLLAHHQAIASLHLRNDRLAAQPLRRNAPVHRRAHRIGAHPHRHSTNVRPLTLAAASVATPFNYERRQSCNSG